MSIPRSLKTRCHDKCIQVIIITDIVRSINAYISLSYHVYASFFKKHAVTINVAIQVIIITDIVRSIDAYICLS